MASGGGGGQVVSVLVIFSGDPSSNPTDAYRFFCKIVFQQSENKHKMRPGLDHFLKPLVPVIVVQVANEFNLQIWNFFDYVTAHLVVKLSQKHSYEFENLSYNFH